MKIYTIPLGPVQSNMYLVDVQDAFFIVDPSCPPDSIRGGIKELFEKNGPAAVFVTHGHFDHMFYMEEWKEKYPDSPVYMSVKDRPLLARASANCSDLTFRGSAVTPPPDTHLLSTCGPSRYGKGLPASPQLFQLLLRPSSTPDLPGPQTAPSLG